MQRLALVLFVFTAGCLPELQPNQIVVDGEAVIKRAPDQFKISAAIRSRESDEAAALSDISATLANIRDQLPNLEGLTHLDIDADDVTIRAVLDPECREKARYGAEGECPVIGHFGSVELSVTGAPAENSGNTLSALSELGAENVSLSGYSILDAEQARADAMEAAVRDARQKADTIAAATGSTVVGTLRIQYGEGFSDDGRYYDRAMAQADLVVVTASRQYAPETDLVLEPSPIAIREKVVAAFEIE